MDEIQSHPLVDVEQQTLAYFDGNALASSTWIKHYAKKDRDGNLYEKSPADMFARITTEIERIEQRYPQPISGESVQSYWKASDMSSFRAARCRAWAMRSAIVRYLIVM